jgi:large subunit ribosomal protein L21
MYAIVQDGGKQYWVEPGKELNLELKHLEDGEESIQLDQVLLVGEGEETKVGTPLVDGATVNATVLGEVKGKKLDLMVWRRRKNSRRRSGHRQKYLRVRIEEIKT